VGVFPSKDKLEGGEVGVWNYFMKDGISLALFLNINGKKIIDFIVERLFRSNCEILMQFDPICSSLECDAVVMSNFLFDVLDLLIKLFLF